MAKQTGKNKFVSEKMAKGRVFGVHKGVALWKPDLPKKISRGMNRSEGGMQKQRDRDWLRSLIHEAEVWDRREASEAEMDDLEDGEILD